MSDAENSAFDRNSDAFKKLAKARRALARAFVNWIEVDSPGASEVVAEGLLTGHRLVEMAAMLIGGDIRSTREILPDEPGSI